MNCHCVIYCSVRPLLLLFVGGTLQKPSLSSIRQEKKKKHGVSRLAHRFFAQPHLPCQKAWRGSSVQSSSVGTTNQIRWVCCHGGGPSSKRSTGRNIAPTPHPPVPPLSLPLQPSAVVHRQSLIGSIGFLDSAMATCVSCAQSKWGGGQTDVHTEGRN